MDLQELMAYCQTKPMASQEFKEEWGAWLARIGNKMFALMSEGPPGVITLKCDPDRVDLLRSTYPAVRPGYYMNKRHWNTVTLDGSIPADELRAMVDHSYERVVATLTKKERAALGLL